MINAAVIGTGHSLPDRSLSSCDIEARVSRSSPGFEMQSGMIEKITGVRARRHAEPGVTSSDLAAAAALDALASADVDAESIDLLIFASATHDVSEPATAAIVQEKVGCTNATFVDVKNACNSFLNGLDFAAASIATGRARRVLVTSGEVLSPTINWQVSDLLDLRRKFAAFTLGDAGGAVLLEASAEEGRGLLPGRFYSDGSAWELSTVLYGGTLMGRDTSRSYFECDSKQLQQLALDHIPPLVEKTLGEVNWRIDQVDHIIPHQVSTGVVTALCALIGFPQERVRVTVDEFGNTAAASIPLALSLAADQGTFTPGDKILLVCGAAGFTAGVLPIIW